MNAVHFTKDISAANTLTTGSAILLFGPFPVDHLDNFALHFVNCAVQPLYLTLKTSYDEARQFEDAFPLGSFTNSAAVAVQSASTLVRSLYGHSNPFRYITVFGSSTATITSAETCLKISGRTKK